MGFIVIFAYDHTGERTLKMTGDATSVNQNAFNNHIYSSLNNVTLYPSPYLVLTNSGYTKHYYAGADRVCARIGSGGLNQDTTGIRGTSEISQCVDSLFLHCIEQMNNYVPSADTGNIVTIDGEALLDTTSTNTNKTPTGLHVDVVPNITRFNAVFDESLSENHSPRAPYYEPDVYFYHSDHLGSASWITDGEGNAVQHLQYLPFGQPYINQHPTGYQERYTFTGKELDPETGYGYHGARYMDYELMTCWLSVDPMADKYPSISPYAYCMWNTVKLIDPNGEVPILYGLLQYQGLSKHGNDYVGETQMVGNFHVVPFYDNNNSLIGYNAGRFRPDGSYATEYQMEPGDIEMFSQNVKTYEVAANLVYCNGEPDWSSASFGQHMSTGDLKGMVSDIGNMWADVFKNPENCLSFAVSIAGNGMTTTVTKPIASKAVRSLQRNIREHEQKLGQYLSNPASMDNKGILNGASYTKFKSIFYGRVAHLEKEIETFKKNIEDFNK